MACSYKMVISKLSLPGSEMVDEISSIALCLSHILYYAVYISQIEKHITSNIRIYGDDIFRGSARTGAGGKTNFKKTHT
jgi:hypothetical protein